VSARKKALRERLEQTLVYLKVRLDWQTAILDSRKTGDVIEGYGRLDALNRIGNQVFFENMLPRLLVKCAVAIRSENDDQKKQLRRRQCAKGLSLPENSFEDIPFPDEKLTGNFRRIDAPVSFPPLWGVSWFSWAQYDASVLNELVRNAGEALGVSAIFNSATGPKTPTYKSSIELQNIYWMESMLRGEHPLKGQPGFKGLRAPKWPGEFFPNDEDWKIDQKLVDEGRELYRMHCVECHRAPVSDPKFDVKWPDDSIWNTDRRTNWINIKGEKYLNLVQKQVKHLGTDPQQASVLSSRKIHIPESLKLDPIEILNRDHPNSNCGLPDDPALNSVFALALMGIVDKAIDQWFADHPQYAEREKEMRGPRPNCPNPLVFRKDKIVIRPVYRARPLDGVWATAPYLHNGSVPTLEDMLKKASDRVKAFCVGSRQFDPVAVGLKLEFSKEDKLRDKTKECARGLTRIDTNLLGSSNAGHSFEGNARDDKRYRLGVVGPAFNATRRKQLIEYLKTL
jgi:hypothetical protein